MTKRVAPRFSATGSTYSAHHSLAAYWPAMRNLPTGLPLRLGLFLVAASCSTSRVQVTQAQEGTLPARALPTETMTGAERVPGSPGLTSGVSAIQTRTLPIGVRDLPDGSLMLLFPPRLLEPAFDRLEVRHVRPLLAGLTALTPLPAPRFRLLEGAGAERPRRGRGSPTERQLGEEFLSLYGSSPLPLPESLETSHLFLALQQSPRFMGEGVREAALELFSSPAFAASICLSVLTYFAAWLAPEPFFSKAFAATLTVRLSLLVGLVELSRVADACLRLYREAEAARSPQELEAAAERFGKIIGGTGLRVLVIVASMGLGRLVPDVPAGGLQAVLEPLRWARVSGPSVGAVSTAKVVAGNTLVVTGAAVGAATSSICGGLGLCATATSPRGSPKLSTRYGPPHTRSNPPHNEAIEKDLAGREAAGHTDLLKNKAQVNAASNRVFERIPGKTDRFRRPDAASVRPDGVRHNINYVSSPRDMRRELEAFESMTRADPAAIHELYLLDGTLVRRHIPAGVSFP